MPLRASIDGKDVIAPLLDDVEWKTLKKATSSGKKHVILPCCQKSGFLRTSPLGTKHFVHKRKLNCNWKPESKEHLKAKEVIAIACKNAGFEVSTEVSGSDWIADVLATDGQLKIAFEVQLSPQTSEITFERDAKYKRDGIECCWFFSKIPLELISTDFRSFEIHQRLDRFVAYLNTILPSENSKKEYKNLHELRIIRNSSFKIDDNGELIYNKLKQKMEPEDSFDEYQLSRIESKFNFYDRDYKISDEFKKYKTNHIELYLDDFVEGFLLKKIKFNRTCWCYPCSVARFQKTLDNFDFY